jgi:hypothetical protein
MKLIWIVQATRCGVIAVTLGLAAVPIWAAADLIRQHNLMLGLLILLAAGVFAVYHSSVNESRFDNLVECLLWGKSVRWFFSALLGATVILWITAPLPPGGTHTFDSANRLGELRSAVEKERANLQAALDAALDAASVAALADAALKSIEHEVERLDAAIADALQVVQASASPIDVGRGVAVPGSHGPTNTAGSTLADLAQLKEENRQLLEIVRAALSLSRIAERNYACTQTADQFDARIRDMEPDLSRSESRDFRQVGWTLPDAVAEILTLDSIVEDARNIAAYSRSLLAEVESLSVDDQLKTGLEKLSGHRQVVADAVTDTKARSDNVHATAKAIADRVVQAKLSIIDVWKRNEHGEKSSGAASLLAQYGSLEADYKSAHYVATSYLEVFNPHRDNENLVVSALGDVERGALSEVALGVKNATDILDNLDFAVYWLGTQGKSMTAREWLEKHSSFKSGRTALSASLQAKLATGAINKRLQHLGDIAAILSDYLKEEDVVNEYLKSTMTKSSGVLSKVPCRIVAETQSLTESLTGHPSVLDRYTQFERQGEALTVELEKAEGEARNDGVWRHVLSGLSIVASPARDLLQQADRIERDYAEYEKVHDDLKHDVVALASRVRDEEDLRKAWAEANSRFEGGWRGQDLWQCRGVRLENVTLDSEKLDKLRQVEDELGGQDPSPPNSEIVGIGKRVEELRKALESTRRTAAHASIAAAALSIVMIALLWLTVRRTLVRRKLETIEQVRGRQLALTDLLEIVLDSSEKLYKRRYAVETVRQMGITLEAEYQVLRGAIGTLAERLGREERKVFAATYEVVLDVERRRQRSIGRSDTEPAPKAVAVHIASERQSINRASTRTFRVGEFGKVVRVLSVTCWLLLVLSLCLLPAFVDRSVSFWTGILCALVAFAEVALASLCWSEITGHEMPRALRWLSMAGASIFGALLLVTTFASVGCALQSAAMFRWFTAWWWLIAVLGYCWWLSTMRVSSEGRPGSSGRHHMHDRLFTESGVALFMSLVAYLTTRLRSGDFSSLLAMVCVIITATLHVLSLGPNSVLFLAGVREGVASAGRPASDRGSDSAFPFLVGWVVVTTLAFGVRYADASTVWARNGGHHFDKLIFAFRFLGYHF